MYKTIKIIALMVLLLLLIVCCRAQTPNRIHDKNFRFRYVFDTTKVQLNYLDTSQHIPIGHVSTGYIVTQQIREVDLKGADITGTAYKKNQWQVLGANKNPIPKNWVIQNVIP